MPTKVVSPKLVYFIHSEPNDDGSCVAYCPTVCPVALRTAFPIVEQILTNNYLLMDVKSFLGYNGLFNGSAVAVISSSPADQDLQGYGKGNTWVRVFSDPEEAIDWLIERATNTSDPDFYVLANPDLVSAFDSYAWDSTVIEINPSEPIAENFVVNPTLVVAGPERWVLNVKATLLMTQAEITTCYYGSSSALNINERVRSNVNSQ